MFTGIVQAVGRFHHLQGPRYTVQAPDAWPGDPFVLGESVAVNGVCLTVVAAEPDLHFDLSEETLAKTTLGKLADGDPVNLERALRPTDRLGGHIVQGHVDQTALITKVLERPDSWEVHVEVGPQNARLLADKGSVTLDGVSLTVIDPQEGVFHVALIPHTWHNTTLNRLHFGAEVNVEFDILTKTVDSLLRHARP